MNGRPARARRVAVRTMAALACVLGALPCIAAPAPRSVPSASRLTAPQLLEQCVRQGGVQYLAAELPTEAADWTGPAADPKQGPVWLRRALGCDVVAYDGLWLVAGRKPRPLPLGSGSQDELREWLSTEVMGGEPEVQEPPASNEAALGEIRAITARAVARMPAVSGGEVALVPLELRLRDCPALHAMLQARAADEALEQVRRAAMPLPTGWVLQAGRELILRDPGEPPRSQIALGPAWQEANEWRDRVLQRPWGLFWWHWRMRSARDTGGTLARPVTLSGTATLAGVAAGIARQAGVPVRVAQALKPMPVALQVREMPLWLLLDGLSAVTGATWGPRAEAAAFELRQDESPPGRVYGGCLSVSQRMAWLQSEEGGASLVPRAVTALTPAQQQSLRNGQTVPIRELSAEQRDALEQYALGPLRAFWLREGMARLGRALKSERADALVVGGREPAVFVRTGNGGWRQCAGPKMLLPVPVMSTDRERRLASALQEYGDDCGIPPRWVFGPRAKPEALVVPRYVAGTAPAAPPKAVLYGRVLGAPADER